MSGPDVRELKREELSNGTFPAPPQADFRLYMLPEVHRGVHDHARTDVSVEICGVLVGRWERDEGGPYAVVTNYIRCDSATSKFAEVTFTHESWAQINKEMDTRFADLRILGWYHSHPDFGIFLSDRDVFIHQNFFSGAGQVAYVVDPVRDLEGVFVWRDGKPEPIEHYWIGNRIRTVDASRRSPAAGSPPVAHDLRTGPGSVAAEDSNNLGLATTLLAWVAVFLLGYLLASTRSRWEQEMIVEGAVAHYGINKLMKVGFEERLNDVGRIVGAIREEVRKLPAPGEKLSKEQTADADKRREVISDNLLLCERALEEIGKAYGLSEEEQLALARLAAEKQAALRRPESRKAEKQAEDKSKAQADKAAKAPAEKAGSEAGARSSEKRASSP